MFFILNAACLWARMNIDCEIGIRGDIRQRSALSEGCRRAKPLISSAQQHADTPALSKDCGSFVCVCLPFTGLIFLLDPLPASRSTLAHYLSLSLSRSLSVVPLPSLFSLCNFLSSLMLSPFPSLSLFSPSSAPSFSFHFSLRQRSYVYLSSLPLSFSLCCSSHIFLLSSSDCILSFLFGLCGLWQCVDTIDGKSREYDRTYSACHY